MVMRSYISKRASMLANQWGNGPHENGWQRQSTDRAEAGGMRIEANFREKKFCIHHELIVL